jgi:membrane protease YdiL (CAAX protease family)
MLFALGWLPLPLLPSLWLLAAGCLVVLLRDPRFDRGRLWRPAGLRRTLPSIVLPFVVAAPLLFLATLILDPERLFAFVRQRPLLWALMMLLYPALSAYPQGIIYRDFVFHRYRTLFRSRRAVLLASAAAFSFVHILFQNWIAPLLSLGGGLLFAWTYEKSGSSLAATAQHALFGCYLFTIGLGWYFYYGAAVR